MPDSRFPQNVSRLAKMIDDAKNRTARQQLPPDFVSELDADPTLQTASKGEVMLDALGNVPMKLYDIYFDDIDEITNTSWMPQMHLTEEERNVVEAKGSVLLLGRSGTGKTICISNRSESICNHPCRPIVVALSSSDELNGLFTMGQSSLIGRDSGTNPIFRSSSLPGLAGYADTLREPSVETGRVLRSSHLTSF